jgi:hypothetical protein
LASAEIWNTAAALGLFLLQLGVSEQRDAASLDAADRRPGASCPVV